MRSGMTVVLIVFAGLLLTESSAHAQRGGRGGGARGGGGMSRGGGGGMQRGGGGGMQRGGFGGGLPTGSGMQGGSRGTAAMGPHGGAGSFGGQSGTGPRGGSYQTGTRSGSYNTQRGGTVNYGAAGVGGTGAGGVNAGRGAYGIQGTTAGGRDYSTVGRAGGAFGPGDYGVGGRSSVGTASGANGTIAGASRSGTAFGPEGAVTGGSRFGAAEGQYGAVAGGSRFGAAAGPEGERAFGERGGVAAGPYGAVGGRRYGTYYNGAGALANQGIAVRTGYAGYAAFNPAWYARYPTAWNAGAWTTASPWAYGNWGAIAGYGGYPQQPVYYDYGSSVVTQPDAVYVNGDPAGTPQQYADQASQIADAGRSAQPADNVQWQPLGVFAMVEGDETSSDDAFQIALSPDGVLRGNYYNARTDQATPIYGSVDPKTMRAAWTVGDQQTPVYEAGLANLTKDETTMLAHYNDGQARQFSLIRLQPPDQENPDTPGAPPQPGANP